MMNIGKPLILSIGTLVGLVSIVLSNRPGYERIPNVDGREYAVNRWTGRVSVIDRETDSAEASLEARAVLTGRVTWVFYLLAARQSVAIRSSSSGVSL